MEEKKKVVVVGMGGVGGYLGGVLAKTYDQVTVVARGERKKSIEENGIVLHSEFHGKITARPYQVVEAGGQITEIQDYVFICVKNYSLEEVCRAFAGCIGEQTVILPIMNGADTGQRTREFLKKGLVVDAVIYITSFFNANYSITQIGQYAKIQIGIQNPSQEQEKKITEVWKYMKKAGLDCHISQDIEAAIWEKYIFNCGYNVLTSYYMNMAEEVQASKEKSQEFWTLMEEAHQVAMAKKVRVREGYLKSEYQRFLSLDAGSTSSMKRDLETGRVSELETFSGYLVSEARKWGVSVPLSEKMYADLKNRIQK